MNGPPLPQKLPPGPWIPAAVLATEDVFPKPYKVLAMRWLAHAAMLKTSSDFTTPPPTAADKTFATNCHEAAMRWIDRYAATNPYDWGTSRSSNSWNMMDFPLLQLDMFSPIYTTKDGQNDVSWFVTSPYPVSNAGQSHEFYAVGMGVDSGGYDTAAGQNVNNATKTGIDATFIPAAKSPLAPVSQSHFTLTDRFAAAERCRQVVFWSVDWQSYMDFETQPSAPMDSHRSALDSRGNYVSVNGGGAALLPEGGYVWADQSRTARTPTTTDPYGHSYQSTGYNFWNLDLLGSTDINHFYLAQYPNWFVGNFGADRNGNLKLDYGTVPASVRLRAVTVARFDVYDRRFMTSLRQ